MPKDLDLIKFYYSGIQNGGLTSSSEVSGVCGSLDGGIGQNLVDLNLGN